MDEIIAILTKYKKDLERMTCAEIKEVAETVDAFMNDYRIMEWDIFNLLFIIARLVTIGRKNDNYQTCQFSSILCEYLLMSVQG